MLGAEKPSSASTLAKCSLPMSNSSYSTHFPNPWWLNVTRMRDYPGRAVSISRDELESPRTRTVPLLPRSAQGSA
jgi:hypothetical protein